MAPQIDPLIPPLLTASGAATVLGCSRTWLTRLLQDGDLQYLRVGRLTVLAKADVTALAKQRKRGVPGWRLSQPGAALPPLASTADAAVLLGYAQDNWPRELFRRGELAGVKLGPDVLFRRQLLADRALARSAAAAASLR